MRTQPATLRDYLKIKQGYRRSLVADLKLRKQRRTVTDKLEAMEERIRQHEAMVQKIREKQEELKRRYNYSLRETEEIRGKIRGVDGEIRALKVLMRVSQGRKVMEEDIKSTLRWVARYLAAVEAGRVETVEAMELELAIALAGDKKRLRLGREKRQEAAS